MDSYHHHQRHPGNFACSFNHLNTTVLEIFTSYAQAVGGVPPSSPFQPQQFGATRIVTTVVPIGPHPTHTICPSCHAEIDTNTRTEPGVIAYVSGFVIAM